MEKGYGASVRGKMHRRIHKPNQDNYLVYNTDNLTLAVVCDGMGSKKHSKYGSKKLCKIIKTTIIECTRKKSFNIVSLIDTITKRWIKGVFPFSPSSCNTTCLFSLISPNSILMCQLGDGILAYTNGSDAEIISNKDSDFVNETNGIYNSDINNWKIKNISKDANTNYKLLLCTDGISEDLIQDSLNEFIQILSNKIDGKFKNNKVLKELLINWPNKYSNDDKTIVVVK